MNTQKIKNRLVSFGWSFLCGSFVLSLFIIFLVPFLFNTKELVDATVSAIGLIRWRNYKGLLATYLGAFLFGCILAALGIVFGNSHSG
ncbi:hypothetical protein [Crenothrix polyspora]|uniref:Uncharacterized protein n=1 Tax=Crenothrix polyspora TaxID=360316 RepID=A0A1R4HE28_9GAMM|nr:hypothetical protein [Crenothrix polyspora]SJM94495.1 hypothetical protein CRENPOLYSF1_540058 [Crenothrix polyspora]